MFTSATGTDLNIIGRKEMGEFRNGRSRYIYIAKFDHLSFCSEIYHCWCDLFHTIFALHGFDFRTCLQVHTAVLCAQQYRERVPKGIAMRLNLTINLTLNQTPN